MRKTALVSMTARTGRSRGECFDQQSLRNLRTRRVLRLSELYRRFECLSLRHAVYTAENSHPYFVGNARILPIFIDFRQMNRTGENGLLDHDARNWPEFSLLRQSTVRLHPTSSGEHQATANRMIGECGFDFEC